MELRARAAKGEFIMIKIIITDDQDIVREGLASCSSSEKSSM